jgi:hypothetical protein
MKSELAEEIFELIEARSHARPTPMEFEMAYQARVAVDRIRFAIKHTEQFAPSTDQMRNVGFQLLDALQRLEAVDRRFQERYRLLSGTEVGKASDGGQLGVDKTSGRCSNAG